MIANSEEVFFLKKTHKLFCSSSVGSFEALHTAQLLAATVLKNCSYSHFAPLPRMQQDCGADPAGTGRRGSGGGDRTAALPRGGCEECAAVHGAALRYVLRHGVGTQDFLCCVSAQSKVS